MFDIDSIREIFEFCKRGEYYNFSALKRTRVLATIMYNEKRDRLDLPIIKFMQKIDYFINEYKNTGVTKVQITKFIQDFALEYARQESSKEIPIWTSSIALEEINRSLTEIFKCLVDLGRVRKDRTMTINKCELLWQEKSDNIYEIGDDIKASNFILGNIMEFDVKSIDFDNIEEVDDETNNSEIIE